MSKSRLVSATTKGTIVTLFVGLSLCTSSGSTAELPLTFRRVAVPFSGVDQTIPGGLNDQGDLVGGFHDPQTGGHSFLLTHGVFEAFDFPSAERVETFAAGLNNRGQIVGFIDLFAGGNCCERHGFLLEAGVFNPIDAPFPGVTQTTAVGINDRGQLIGVYTDATGLHGFVLAAGVFSPLDVPFPGAVETSPSGINNRGQIVGTYRDTEGLHGFVCNQGACTVFTGPDGIPAVPVGVNDRGQIVGSTGGHGFVWDHGRFCFIDVPFAEARPGSTMVVGINNRGQLSGVYTDATGLILGFRAE